MRFSLPILPNPFPRSAQGITHARTLPLLKVVELYKDLSTSFLGVLKAAKIVPQAQ